MGETSGSILVGMRFSVAWEPGQACAYRQAGVAGRQRQQKVQTLLVSILHNIVLQKLRRIVCTDPCEASSNSGTRFSESLTGYVKGYVYILFPVGIDSLICKFLHLTICIDDLFDWIN